MSNLLDRIQHHIDDLSLYRRYILGFVVSGALILIAVIASQA